MAQLKLTAHDFSLVVRRCRVLLATAVTSTLDKNAAGRYAQFDLSTLFPVRFFFVGTKYMDGEKNLHQTSDASITRAGNSGVPLSLRVPVDRTESLALGS